MAVDLKLKQASAVLGVSAKELQNLVQFKVISPPRRDNLYRFDRQSLLQAKVALYLKESLGSSSELLSLFTGALSKGIGKSDPKRRRFLSLRSLPRRGRHPVEIRIPLASLARELDEQMPNAEVAQDLPRGRKRAGWRNEMSRALAEAADQLGPISTGRILATVREARRERKDLPEVTVVAKRTFEKA